MENKQHHYARLCVILCMMGLPASIGWAAQPMSEGTLALQTGLANNILPNIIIKAEQDAMKPEQERWRVQRALSDRYLREVRISTLLDSVLSPHEEQKKTKVTDPREKKDASIKPHTQPSDRFVVYEFDSNDNVHGTVTIHVKER
ncbi:hypothetical protein MMO38_03745 [Acinetobacter sp. NIPH 1852]|uniref:hypothetical protein n=1 Tax=Acinetobacter sp. NIPH 1852 TaxID=2923428 RepID=UPI001F4A8F13|nr:hypothetical protein [Acinetobacter sp. NIPH 1852]MCH7307257.1 hypothetical protein [Acinetobacter sp. NIPH 1852]